MTYNLKGKEQVDRYGSATGENVRDGMGVLTK